MKLLIGAIIWVLSSIGVVVGLAVADLGLQEFILKRFKVSHGR